VLSALAGVVVVLALLTHTLITRQDHQIIREQLSAKFNEASGLRLSVKGPMELPYSLLPTVVLRNIEIRNPNAPGFEHLLSAGELRLTIALLPLFRDEVLVDDFVLTDVRMELDLPADGEPNWVTETESGRSSLPRQLAIHSIDADRIDVSFENHLTGFAFDVHIDELDVRVPALGEDVEFELRTDYRGVTLDMAGTLGSTKALLSGETLAIDVSADVGDIDLEVTGRIDRIDDGDIAGMRAAVSAWGNNLADLSPVLKIELPETRRFELAAVLTAPEDLITASNIDASIAWLDNEANFNGEITDLDELAGIEIEVEIAGANLFDTLALLNVDRMPATDEYAFTGKLAGDWPSIRISDARLAVGHANVQGVATGGVQNASELEGFDLLVELNGTDLTSMSRYIDVPLPSTDSFEAQGRLTGTRDDLAVSDARVSLRRDGLALELRGALADVFGLAGIDVDFTTSGGDLASIAELRRFEPPRTDHFEASGTLRGHPGPLSVTSMQAELARDAHELTIAGDVLDIAEFDGIDWAVSAQGHDLSELSDVMNIEFPPSASYRIEGVLYGNAATVGARDVSLRSIADGLSLDLQGQIGRLPDLDGIDLSGRLEVESLARLSPYVDRELPETDAMTITGRLTGSVPDLALDDFTFRSGDSQIVGSASLHTGEQPAITGSVTEGALDIRPYMIAARDRAEARKAETRERVFSSRPLDFSILDSLDADLSLDNLEILSSAGSLTVRQARLVLESGTLVIDPMELVRSDATVRGRLLLDRSTTPRIDTDLEIVNVDLDTFMQDIRQTDIFDGKLDLTVNVRGEGSSIAEMMAGIEGELKVFVSSARISQVSLPLRTTDLLFELLPWVKRAEDLVINCAIAQLSAEDGVATIDFFYLDSSQMRMVGGGTIDLRDEMLDIRLAPRRRRSRIFAHNIDLLVSDRLAKPRITSTGASKAAVTTYGMYALFGPMGLLVPTSRSTKHPCFGSLQEYRARQDAAE